MHSIRTFDTVLNDTASPFRSPFAAHPRGSALEFNSFAQCMGSGAIVMRMVFAVNYNVSGEFKLTTCQQAIDKPHFTDIRALMPSLGSFVAS